MSNKSRKTLTLGLRDSDLKININSYHGRRKNASNNERGNKEIENLLKNIDTNHDFSSQLKDKQQLRNLDKKPISVKLPVTTDDVSTHADSPQEEQKQKSIHQILAEENRKKKEGEERDRQKIIAKKEEDRKKKQEEDLKKFNSRGKFSKNYNKSSDVNAINNGQSSWSDRNRSERGENRNGNRDGGREGNREGNRDGSNNNRPFSNNGDNRRSFSDRNFNRNFSNNNGGNNRFNRNTNLAKLGGSTNFSDKRHSHDAFNKTPNFVLPSPVIIENNTTKKKKDFKKDYKDNDNINNKKQQPGNRGRKIMYVADDDVEGITAKRRKASYFKNKDKLDSNSQEKIIHDVELPEFITVADLSDKMGEKRADVIKKLISMGMVVTINQTIDADTAELIVAEFGHNVKKRTTEHDMIDKLDEKKGENFISRAPVVTIMGHVDHGKTSLLDAIRTTRVVDDESGGITQHIGASRVQVGDNKFITFIDTPGHEAFTEMRMRGANITDVVVLVVAADDGVKEQTIEAINHAKIAKVPIILAINKIDKPSANPSKVKQELLQYDIITEEFGGDVMSVEVSAKEHKNLDKLKETILLQAELMDLKSPIDVNPSGVVIESKMDQNKGSMATLLVQKGILKEGDLVLTGTSYGRIKRMTDDNGKSQKEAYPSMAVEILGFDSVPSAGDTFNVIDSDKEARDIIAYRSRKELENKVAKRNIKSLDSMLKVVGGKSAKLLPVIIKADVNGSIEAISGTLTKLNTNEVEIDVIHSTTGAINESDINLASVSNAVILGFNVRASASIVELAKKNNIDIRYYSIIYNIVDDMKKILSGMLDPTIREDITGHAEVRQIFKITNVGNIAGSFVTDGELSRNNQVRLIRDGIVIYTGNIGALKRFKDDIKEVKTGFECGISIEGYSDIREKDIIESFKIVEEKREL